MRTFRCSSSFSSKNKMSTKDENRKNDWENSDEEDNWEDWGDAEDNIVAPKSTNATISSEAIKINAVSSIQNNNNDAKDAKKVEPTQQQITPEATGSSWGLWGGKLTSVLSTATEGLGTITSSVNQSLNQIIGVPDPEEMARMNAAEETQKKGTQSTNETQETTTQEVEQVNEQLDTAPSAFGLSLVSGVTTLGSKVLNTGLDTLEGIGKKTMHILQENDPKLINKRKLLGLETEKQNLSALLQEAKNDADHIEAVTRQLRLEKTKAQLRFEILFENFCGLVHFEALEILSKESEIKLRKLLDSVSGNALSELQETINEVKELLEMEDIECESDGDYDAAQLNERLTSSIEDFEINIQFDDIVNNWSTALEWLNSTAAKEADIEEAFAKSVTALSEACALEMCKLHKIAELLLVKEQHSTASEVDCIVQLCKQFNGHLQGLTHRCATVLSAKGSDVSKQPVNVLFSELLVAVQHIEHAYRLFTPILQMGAV